MARKVEFEFNPFKLTNTDKPKGASKREILEEVRDFVLESVLDTVGDARSPVARGSGGAYPWKRSLSKGYKEFKKGKGRLIANMELSGDMLDAVRAPIRGSTITLKVGGKEGDKADGHNDHSGDSDLPLRRFVPSEKDKDTFTKPILSGIKRIIKSFEE